MPRTPAKQAKTRDVQAFLQRARNVQRFSAGQSRLIFAIDATASRQATWDLACDLQANMFQATKDLASLSIQLAYYRGIGELQLESWQSDTAALAQRMSRVQCAAGRTQIGPLLRAALKQQSRAKAEALVFIGDAVEENTAILQDLAGQCRLQSLPLFIFQEGYDPTVKHCFQTMARLSGGAYEHFDQSSARRLQELLGAVARYAAGGRKALENNPTAESRRLLEQLKR
ncbi:hypothetical protein [Congregibacter litoralis]|uniref:von Willebrand factor type A domain protein n=1 Tax=Congregibacter litoralis KT71 TaxID=314285 RepID=A4AAP1_9GAMM|nr:hypothetical protein [Congregibacter litoralis]EAQ96763.1 von Willebrand factor type A domain protein [Congregibacter litoralis KT71]